MSAPATAARPAPAVPLVELTLAKLAVNAGLRLPYPFLASIASGLGLTLSQTGRLLGLGELLGFGAFVVGRSLESGRFRRALVGGMCLATVGMLLEASVHRSGGLLVGAGFVSLGTAATTTAGHSLLGVAVPVTVWARAVGIFETSWAFALLIGAPIAALVIRLVGWYAPFVLYAAGTAAMVAVLLRRLPVRHTVVRHDDPAAAHGDAAVVLHPPHWPAVISAVSSSLLLTLGAVMVFATFGPWLEDSHGFTTGSVSAVAFSFGAVELLASTGTARFVDRIGHRRATAMGAVVMVIGAVALSAVRNGGAGPIIASLVVLFGGFEFAYVSLLSVVAGVGGSRAGTVVGVDHTLVTGFRAMGAALGPWIYERSGMRSILVVTAISAAACAVVVRVGERSDPRRSGA